MTRREYDIRPFLVNDIIISKLIIDLHVDKHSDHVSDDLVKKLICHLEGKILFPVSRQGKFEYFVSMIKLGKYFYKMVWLLEDHFSYIGILTVFIDRRIKWDTQPGSK
jgi:hypothetical protein